MERKGKKGLEYVGEPEIEQNSVNKSNGTLCRKRGILRLHTRLKTREELRKDSDNDKLTKTERGERNDKPMERKKMGGKYRAQVEKAKRITFLMVERNYESKCNVGWDRNNRRSSRAAPYEQQRKTLDEGRGIMENASCRWKSDLRKD
ncbi:hypothetical protein Tco_0115240 [Tanacetum coccineum]